MTNAASIATVCIYCGNKEADAQTGRCLGCGRVVISPSIAQEFSHPTLDRGAGVSRHSPSGAYRGNGTNGTAPAAATSPAPAPVVELPAVAAEEPAPPAPPVVAVDPLDAWLAQAREIRDRYLADAERTDQEAKAQAAESKRLRGVADELAYVIELIEGGPEHTAAAAPPVTTSSKARGKWSKNASACIDCGRSDLPHVGLDRCRTCYDAKYAREHRKAS